MPTNRSQWILAALLSLYAATAHSQHTVSATISAASSTTPALQQCDSVCALMAYPVPGAAASLFASYCAQTGRADCGTEKMQFKVDLVGRNSGFECVCDLPPPGPELASVQSSVQPQSQSQAPVANAAGVPATLEVSKTADAATETTSAATPSVPPSESLPSSVSPSTSSPPPTSTPTTPAPTSASASASTSKATALTPTTTATTTKTPTTSSPPPPPAEPTTAPASKTTTGTVVGIVVGVLCILACSGAGVLALYRRRQKRKINQGFIDDFRACSEAQGV